MEVNRLKGKKQLQIIEQLKFLEMKKSQHWV